MIEEQTIFDQVFQSSSDEEDDIVFSTQEFLWSLLSVLLRKYLLFISRASMACSALVFMEKRYIVSIIGRGYARMVQLSSD